MRSHHHAASARLLAANQTRSPWQLTPAKWSGTMVATASHTATNPSGCGRRRQLLQYCCLCDRWLFEASAGFGSSIMMMLLVGVIPNICGVDGYCGSRTHVTISRVMCVCEMNDKFTCSRVWLCWNFGSARFGCLCSVLDAHSVITHHCTMFPLQRHGILIIICM